MSEDMVNHPSHYTSHPSGVECIQITQHMNFCMGNAMKYIWRADSKGSDIQDLEKAVFYLNQEIERRKKLKKFIKPRKKVSNGIFKNDEASILDCGDNGIVHD